MSKRVAAASLWFLVGWVAGAILAFALGTTSLLAPLVGILAAALVYRDPRGWIWTR